LVHAKSAFPGDPGPIRAVHPQSSFVNRFAPQMARRSGSVVVPRHALLRDAMIFHGGLENHAGGELIDHAALDLLPWGLARRRFLAAPFFPPGAALRPPRVLHPA